MGLWWALAVVSAAAVVFYVTRRDWPVTPVRRTIIVGLMVLGMLGPLAIALNPIWIEPIPPPAGRPKITVLVDGTASMNVEDADPGGKLTRWQRGLELAAQVKSLDSSVDVSQQAFFADETRSLASLDTPNNQSVKPQTHRTDLANAIDGILRNGSPAGHAVLLISDGAHNAGSSQSVVSRASAANSLATPIFTVTLGSQVGMKNLSVAARSPRMIAFPNHPLHLRVRIGQAGLAGQSTEVSLMDEGRVIEQRRVRLQSDPNQEIRFTLPDGPRGPLQRYQVVASEVPGEATTSDNRTTVLVQRLDAPIEVLLLEGKPYWDSKFLARNLGSDPVLQLTSITKIGPQRFLERRLVRPSEEQTDGEGSGESDSTTDASSDRDASDGNESGTQTWRIQTELESPLDRLELLEKYRLVILGRDADRFLSSEGIANLRTWIAKSGGCLICARGAPSDEVATRLAEILPVRWIGQEETRFRTRVTQLGLDTAMFDPLLAEGGDPLASLPSLASTARPASRVGLPQVLLQSVDDGSGASVPVVTYQPYGSGQTIVVEGAGMWRWAFLPPEHANKDKIFPIIWQSLVQWVISGQDFMPGQDVAIRSDRASFMAGERVTASVLVRTPSDYQNAQGQLTLTVLLQETDEALPRRFPVLVSGLEDELYRVDFGQLDAGLHSAKVVQGDEENVMAATSIEIRDPWFESLEVDARPDLMRRIAQTSGGEVLTQQQVSSMVDRFEQLRKDSLPQKMSRSTMWDRPSILLMILGVWSASWVVRRRSGLI